MFGIGLGELVLIMLIVFLISPKELPKVMRKVGQFFNELNKIKSELLQVRKDLEEITKDAGIDDDLIKSTYRKNRKKSTPPGVESKVSVTEENVSDAD
jgi:Sec-independent protein translocase protein TatA